MDIKKKSLFVVSSVALSLVFSSAAASGAGSGISVQASGEYVTGTWPNYTYNFYSVALDSDSSQSYSVGAAGFNSAGFQLPSGDSGITLTSYWQYTASAFDVANGATIDVQATLSVPEANLAPSSSFPGDTFTTLLLDVGGATTGNVGDSFTYDFEADCGDSAYGPRYVSSPYPSPTYGLAPTILSSSTSGVSDFFTYSTPVVDLYVNWSFTPTQVGAVYTMTLPVGVAAPQTRTATPAPTAAVIFAVIGLGRRRRRAV